METITFTTNDGQKIEMTVKSEFATKCPDYLNTPTLKLLQDFEVMNFWHNPNGPAVIDHKIGNKTYCLDGKPIVDAEEIKKIQHRENFNTKMDKVLSDDVAG